uniref:C2H2-type domain-containing protein n=1 Tax=Ganoderma boninense TaxID=34458 RepID=A0A5K1K6N7_9APHY|nr:C2H2-type domain-containing protein [Ganoderma boninense]
MSVDLGKLEAHLATRSYVEGYTPSQADVAVFKAISAAPSASANPSVARWYTHIKSYEAEFGSLSGSSSAGEAFIGGAAAAAPAAEEDDDDIDLFGDDDEEDAEAERIKAERVAAYNAKKAAKPKTVAKVRLLSRLRYPSPVLYFSYCSVVTLEVKPWDDETDMVKLEESVRSIQQEGLVWGASKLVPIGYGIKKLQITIVVEDELVSLDDLQERVAEFEDYVQSSDVAAMQKL